MLVDNHKNMLKEALRVTQSGAALAFTVWGRKQNIQNFEILDEVLIKHDLKSKIPPAKTSYDLGKDPEALRTEMESLGFLNVRIWYQPMNFNFKNADVYTEAICNTVTAQTALKKSTPEVRDQIISDLKDLYNQRMGPTVLDPNSFEVMIITAIKP